MGNQLLNQFSSHLRRKSYTKTTIKQYVSNIDQFLSWYQDEYKKEITDDPIEEMAVQKYFTLLREKESNQGAIEKVLYSIVILTHWLEDQNLIPHGIPIPILKDIQTARLEPLTEEETQILIEAVEQDLRDSQKNHHRTRWLRYRDALIVRLILLHKVEPKHVHRIRLSDVELRNNVYHIAANPKTASLDIDLDERTNAILKGYLNIRPLNAEEYLFISRQGERLSSRTVRRAVNRYQHALNSFGKRGTPVTLHSSEVGHVS